MKDCRTSVMSGAQVYRYVKYMEKNKVARAHSEEVNILRASIDNLRSVCIKLSEEKKKTESIIIEELSEMSSIRSLRQSGIW